MEFKSLKNIETSFQQIRIIAIVFLCFCLLITLYGVYASYSFAEAQRQRIYVLDGGKSLMLALSQDASMNRPVEAREHVKRFHELFFTLSPDREAIRSQMERAFALADKSAYNYYKDFSEKGYYNRLISGNVFQRIEIDSLRCDFNGYPYKVMTYGKMYIVRPSNITERRLITSGELVNTVRSDNNPQGFMLERFLVLDNKDIRTIKRTNSYEQE